MAEDRQSSKRDSCAWFQPCAASPMNQPESRDQALLRARRLHWAIGHSLPKRRTRSNYRPTQTRESFFHYQGTAAVDTRLSSSKRRRGPGRGGAFYQFPPLSDSLPARAARGESQKAASARRAQLDGSQTHAPLVAASPHRATLYLRLPVGHCQSVASRSSAAVPPGQGPVQTSQLRIAAVSVGGRSSVFSRASIDQAVPAAEIHWSFP